jgi:hypothetical protein
MCGDDLHKLLKFNQNRQNCFRENRRFIIRDSSGARMFIFFGYRLIHTKRRHKKRIFIFRGATKMYIRQPSKLEICFFTTAMLSHTSYVRERKSRHFEVYCNEYENWFTCQYAVWEYEYTRFVIRQLLNVVSQPINTEHSFTATLF